MNFIYRFFIIIIFIITFDPNNSVAQQSDYNLLWEITHADKAQISYLFGTMHLSDKRIFHLPDSVWIALENTDAVATEINFDSNGMDLCDYLEKAESTPSFDALDPKDQENQMSTFLDMYLMQYAKSKGKSAHGLEDWQDQLEVSDQLISDERDMEEFADKYLDTLITLYNQGHLQSLVGFLQVDETLEDYTIMVKRNNLMARQMDSLMETGSLFTAIGAAHLYGSDNVIDLLRDSGYKLRPVKATYDRAINLPPRIFQDLELIELRKPEAGISFKLPKNYCTTDDLGYTMDIAMDIGSGLSYTVFTTRTILPADSLRAWTDRIGEEMDSIFSIREREIDGLRVIDVSSFSDTYVFSRFIFNNDFGFWISAYSDLQQGLEEALDKLYSTVRYFEPKFSVCSPQNFVEPNGDYSIIFPGAPSYRIQSQETSLFGQQIIYNAHQYFYQDPSGDVYITQHYVMPEGVYLSDAYQLLRESHDNLVAKLGVGFVDDMVIGTSDGHPSARFRGMSNGYHIQADLIMRGNKAYTVMHMSQDSSAYISSFYNTFKFQPVKIGETRSYDLVESNVKLIAPTEMDINIDSTYYTSDESSMSHSYNFRDSISGIYMSLDYFKVSDYARHGISSDSSLTVINEHLFDSTEVAVMRDTIMDRSVLIYSENFKLTKNNLNGYRRLYINQNAYYLLHVYAYDQLDLDGYLEPILASFTITDPQFYKTSDLPAEALNCILNCDLFQQAKAINSIDLIEWDKSYYNKMEQVMLNPNVSSEAKSSLAPIVYQLDTIHGIALLEDLMTQVDKGDIYAYDILDIFCSHDAIHGTDLYYTYFDHVTPTIDSESTKNKYYAFFNYPQYLDQTMDRLTPLIKSDKQLSNFISTVEDIFVYGLDSLQGYPDISNYLRGLLNRDVQKLKSNLQSSDKTLDGRVSQLISILAQQHPDSETKTILRSLTTFKHLNQAEAARRLMDAQELPDSKDLDILLQDSLHAFEIAASLNYNKLMEAFPKQGTVDNDVLAIADIKNVFAVFSNKEMIPVLMRKQTVNFRGNPHTLYVYEVDNSTNGTKHIAISGPYPMHIPNNNRYNYLTDFNDDIYTEDNVDEIIEALLARYHLEE